MQQLAHERPPSPDVRPALGQALMAAMACSIQLPLLRRLPVPMTRWLIGRRAAQAIGVGQRVDLSMRLLFGAGLVAARGIDAIARLFWPQFSLTRLFTRVLATTC
jgi:hypothetical protein